MIHSPRLASGSTRRSYLPPRPGAAGGAGLVSARALAHSAGVEILGITDPALRLGCYAAIFAAVALGQALAPRRQLGLPRLRRGPSNLAIVALDTMLLRAVFQLGAVGVALIARARVHHADLDIDVTTGSHFHPVETLLSMALKCAGVIALGAPPAAVLLFEVLLNATAMFNHGNCGFRSGSTAGCAGSR